MRFYKGLLVMSLLVAGSLSSGILGSLEKPRADDLVIERFPAEVGKSWDYRRTFYVVVYDTASGDTLEYLVVDSVHGEFISVDTLDGWECYKYNSQLFDAGEVFLNTIWYAHPDTAFLAIAYSSATHGGPPWKDPRTIRVKFGGSYFNSLDELRRHLYQLRFSSFANTFLETTYWKPPKKLFVFPLTVGTRWVSMTDPWKEEREVIKEEFVNVPAGSFLALKMEIRPDMEGFLAYQWLAERGVIKDSAYFDTTEATNEFGEVIGYALGYDKYELVGHGATEVESDVFQNQKPGCFSLEQNYPNPFNPETVVRFSLDAPHPTNATLTIYNILGEKVRVLLNEQKTAGTYEVMWDGTDDRGKDVASGIYLYKLQVDESTESKKMMLLR
jgi:hypothetical protein